MREDNVKADQIKSVWSAWYSRLQFIKSNYFNFANNFEAFIVRDENIGILDNRRRGNDRVRHLAVVYGANTGGFLGNDLVYGIDSQVWHLEHQFDLVERGPVAVSVRLDGAFGEGEHRSAGGGER